MKVIEKAVEIKRDFTIRFSEEELGTLRLALGAISDERLKHEADMTSAASAGTVPYLKDPDEVLELYNQLGAVLSGGNE